MSHVFSTPGRHLPLSLRAMTANPVADRWLESPLGAAVLALETRLLQDELADVVGFELLQIGRWGEAARLCAAARTQHRCCIAPDARGPRRDPRRTSTRCRSRPIRSRPCCCRTRSSTRRIRTNCCARSSACCVGEGHVRHLRLQPARAPGACGTSSSRGRFPPPADAADERRRARATGCGLLGFEVVVGAALPVRAAVGAAHVGRATDSWLERRGPDHRAAAGGRVPAQGAQARARDDADPARLDARAGGGRRRRRNRRSRNAA